MKPLPKLIIGFVIAAILTAGGFVLLSGALTPTPELTRPDLAQPDGHGPMQIPHPYPLPVVRIPPQYPQEELALGREGDVVLEFTVTAEGEVTDLVAIKATSEAFARAAMEAVSQWKYTPRRIDGKPVETKGVQTTIEFRLED